LLPILNLISLFLFLASCPQIHDTHGLSYNVSTGVPGSGLVIGTGAPAVSSMASTSAQGDTQSEGGEVSRQVDGQSGLDLGGSSEEAQHMGKILKDGGSELNDGMDKGGEENK